MLYAFDVSEYGSQSGCVLPDGASGGLGRVCAEGAGSKVPRSLGGSVSLLTWPALCPLQILTSGQHPECQERFLGPGMDIRLANEAMGLVFHSWEFHGSWRYVQKQEESLRICLAPPPGPLSQTSL